MSAVAALAGWGRRVAADPAATRRLTTVLLVVVVAVYGLWIGYAVAADRPVDYASYLIATEVVRRGGDPYELDPKGMGAVGADLDVPYDTVPIYRYPPHTTTLFRPFLLLGYDAGLAVWLSLNALALIAGTVLVATALGGGVRVPAGLALLLVFAPAYDTLLAGQINGVVYLSLAIALWGLVAARDIAAAAGLAVGTVVKILPFAIVLYLFWRRRWRVAIASCLAAVVLSLACVAVSGPAVFDSYSGRALDLATSHGGLELPPNPSLTGLVMRTLGPSEVTRIAGVVLGLALACVTAGLCWPRGRFADLVALEFALVVTAVVLAPPFAWFHHLTVLLLPLMVVGNELAAGGRRRALAALAALVLLADLSQPVWYRYREVLWQTGLYRLMSTPVLLSAGLWAVAALLVWRRKWGVGVDRPTAAGAVRAEAD